ncbi:MAG TPA: CHAD domain-containing protein [Allosphingosinicella sp.]|nr:CHAD domain-containing protein [Allosphingosinicella sp.]
MSDEVELKFDVAAADCEALKASAPLTGITPEITEADTVYYDTRDGFVRRSGYSLRVRKAGGRHIQAVKHKPAAAAGLFRRREWETDVPGFALDDAALAKTPLGKLLETEATGPLKQQVRSTFRRTIWLVTRKDSVIEVVLDEGKVAAGKAEAPLCELELELKSGKPRALFALAGEIGAALPLRLGVLSKAERAYVLAERRFGEAARAEPVVLPVPVTEGAAFRAVAQACLRHYRLNEMVLLEQRDADSLHQARIALRRLRSALSLFRPTVRGKDYPELREELGWLAGQFGDARNLDVLLAGEEGLGAEENVRERLLKARAKAYDRVEAALGSDRVRALMLNLSLWIEAGAWRFRDRAMRDLPGLAAEQLSRQWRRVKRNGEKLGKAGAEDRHRLRLDVKKLRYSAEFLAGLSAKRPKLARRDRFVTALKDLQESLGDLNDAEAAQAITTRLAPGLRGNARRLRRKAAAAEAIAAAEEALKVAGEAAGYWE